MLRNRIPIICLFFILLWAACSDNASRSLAEADRLLAENPDSALSIVEAVNPEDLSRESDKALYALLLTEARYKTGTDETNDSLISIATDYYHLQDRNPLRARAYYHKGMIESNAKEYSDVLLSMMIAEETATAVKDTLLLALIHRSMGDAFGNMKNAKTAIGYYQKSYEEFSAVNDSVYTIYALADLARAYYNATNYKVSLSLFKEALDKEEAKEKRDVRFIPYVLGWIGDASQTVKEPEAAIEYLNRLHAEYPMDMKPKNWNQLGLAYLSLGNFEKAQECEDSIKSLSDTPLWLSYCLANARHEYANALALLEHEYHDDNEIYLEWLTRSGEKGLLDQYALLKEAAKKDRKAFTTKIWLLSIIFVLFIVVAVIYIKYLRIRNVNLSSDNSILTMQKKDLHQKEKKLSDEVRNTSEKNVRLQENILYREREIFELRANVRSLNSDVENLNIIIKKLDKERNDLSILIDDLNSEIEQLIGHVANLESGLSARDKVIIESREKLKDVIVSKYTLLDSFIKVYYDAGEGEKFKKEFFNEFLTTINDIRANMGLFKEFEKTVDSHMDNLMKKFRSDYPGLRPEDYSLYLFSVLGFSAKSISVFLQITTENVYTRKHLLKKKISASHPANASYLCFM